MRFSFLDGVFASAMGGFTQDYFVPFFLILGATTKQVGLLNSLSNLCGALIQFKSADLAARFKSRKKIITNGVFLQALMLLPLIFLALFKIINPVIFMVFVVLFGAFNALATPTWASLMSDLVPEDKRGEYFGWRNRILGLLVVIFTFMAGFWLNYTRQTDIFYGFAILFGCAFIFRIISWYFLKLMHEPYLEYHKEHSFSLFGFLSRAKESNFTRFVLCVALMHFSVNLAAPFFSVFMLRDLSFSYLLYTVINITSTLTIYAMMGRWGRHADKVGNIKVIKITSQLIGIFPLFWIINRNPVFLLFSQIFVGIVWSGFNLATSNFVYDAVTPEKRIRCVAYFNIITALGLALGSFLGGVMINKLPPLFGYKILMLFLVSSMLRIVTASFFRMLKEVRPIKEVKSKELLLSVIGIQPII